MLKDGQNGLLVQSHDTALLSEAVQRLILDASLRRRLGEAGLKTAQAELCIDAVMDRTVKFYKDLLERSTSAQDDNKLIEIELRGEKFVG